MSDEAQEVALITGAAGDIGRLIALGLAERGAAVYLLDRHGVDAVVADLDERGFTAEGRSFDVTSTEGWDDVLDAVRRRHGRLDTLVNAAGIEGQSAPIEEQRVADFDTVMRVNAGGTFLAMRASMGALRASRRGAILNIASTAGILGLPGLSPYVASKHAVVGLTRAVAAEVAKAGIRVNAICPGPTAGRMMDALEADARPDAPERARAIYEGSIPMRRYGAPWEIADSALYLTSPAASYITGAILSVDGGMATV
jgi:NAD(P)-dependent dehydrogenase (short-subunit alcohol dehydrogenase family)